MELPVLELADLRPGNRARNEALSRLYAAAVPLAEEVVLCRVLGRYKMFVDARDRGLSPHLMLDGFWEMPVTEALMGFVRSGMTVVDVGANLGYFTVVLAALVGSRGSVHAVEPNPRMMTLLRRSVAVNGFSDTVFTHDQPLSDRSGETVVLQVARELPQNASITTIDFEVSDRHTLETSTIDDLVGESDVDFIKIDAEGAELPIWRGMTRLLGRNKPLVIFMEFLPKRYEKPDAFLADLLAAGFALSLIDPLGGVRPVGAGEVLEGNPDEDRMLVVAR